MRTSLFWVITQRVVIIPCGRFGSACRSHRQGESLKMRPTGCPETSVTNYHYTLRDSLEACRSHLLRGGWVKDSWPLKMGRIGRPETSVRNYHYSCVIAQKSAVLLSNILLSKKFRFFLTVTILRLRHTDQPFNGDEVNNSCLLWESHTTHKYTVWADCRIPQCYM
jgi:hypothetical protein